MVFDTNPLKLSYGMWALPKVHLFISSKTKVFLRKNENEDHF
jgi:hypothetical protein